MNDALPFVHPPEDPSPERSARAFARVQRTVHRRMVRRRVAIALPAATMVLLVVVAAVAWPDADPEVVTTGSSTTTTTSVPTLSIDADMAWRGAVVSLDEMELQISTASRPDGTGACDDHYEMQVAETADAVVVGFKRRPPLTTTTRGPVDCSDQRTPQVHQVALRSPLGERALYNGVDREPQTLSRRADVVDVTWLPRGFVNSSTEPRGYQDFASGWFQTFSNGPSGWYFKVLQAPAGTIPEQEGVASAVRVHGVEGTRYSGQENGTQETIHWVDGGLDLWVTGWVQDESTFIRHDELLQVAQGVRLQG